MVWKSLTRLFLFLISLCGVYPAFSEAPDRPELQQFQETPDGVRPAVPRAMIDIVKKMTRLPREKNEFWADIDYSITVLNSGKGRLGKDTMFLVEQLPHNLILYNGADRSDSNQAQTDRQPIIFESKNSGLNFDMARDVGFSDRIDMPSSFEDCDYKPDKGYDPAVRHICLNPKGIFAAGNPVSEFTIHLQASEKP